MNYKEALKQLNKLLGLSHSFNAYKVKENGQELVVDGALAVGEPIYTITENGQLPAPDMEVELDDSTQIKIKDGKIQEITYDMENPEMFTLATLADGTVVESPTFDVGEDVMVVAADGAKSLAPDGEHELKLKDESGNENIIRIITKDGKIVERMNVEEQAAIPEKEEMGDLSITGDLVDGDFKKMMMEKIDTLMDLVSKLAGEQEDMKSKVDKFSKEPAGSPVVQPKNVAKEMIESRFEAFEKLRSMRTNKK
jgi:hypothetical protein